MLSPAKALDYESPVADTVPQSEPLFMEDAAELIAIMRQHSPQQVAELMKLSDKLASLNVARFEAWQPEATLDNARQAVLAFNGDVYEGLQAGSLGTDALDWMQEHVCILSGLYGVLRPLDLMQPYRLEMGTRLENPHGANLYRFWGRKLADYLNERQADQTEPVVVNLASQEYFKAVDRKVLRARVVECVFQDEKDGQYRVISFYAKRARGLMTRYAAEQRVMHPGQLQGFDLGGYAFAPAASEADRLVFRRAESQRS